MQKIPSLSWLSNKLESAAPALRRVMYFGAVTNLLALMPSVYMLEVYGRVVNSRSHVTLGMLSLLVIAAYIWLEVLEWLRSEMLHQTAAQLDKDIAPALFGKLFDAHLLRRGGAHVSANQDWALLRSFIASQAMVAALDLPYALVVVLILFLIDPWLGLASICVACILILVGWLTDRGVRGHLAEASRASSLAQNFSNGAMRQSELIAAMGMQADMYAIWKEKQDAFLLAQARASDHAGSGAAASKFFQTLQASLMLGLGCWLTLNGSLEPSGGLMIVGSILGGRAIAPIAQIIAQWRQVAQAKGAWGRLDELLGAHAQTQAPMPLPAPSGVLTVQSLSINAPGTQHTVLRGIQFNLNPGEMVAVIGASGAGKTCLSRALVGIWDAASGKVRLDGADVFTWDKAQLGPSVGYLPQGIELFDGTLAENIGRFGQVDLAKLRAATQAAGLDNFIESLPLGFDTPVGIDGANLSGGIRQRIGLARALYGDPALLVLDEPNSSLDESGDKSLLSALSEAKGRGATLVVVTHRPQILELADKLLILRDGQMQAFGPREQVVEALKQAMAKARAGDGAP
jgi:ATP-binding cassette subfamily C exporter for protease/lipase